MFDSFVSNPYVAPLLADDLSGLPGTMVVVGEFDVLRDDGLLFASRLREMNVTVEVVYVNNQGHGFMAPRVHNSYISFRGATSVWNQVYAFLKEKI